VAGFILKRPPQDERARQENVRGGRLGPKDVDIFNPYDGYAPMAQFFLEAFQWHSVKRGDAFAFYAGDIRVERPHPFCSSGGNLGNGRTRTAMYTDSIEQLRGTAGARQVRFGQRLRWRHSPRQAMAAGSCSANTRADGR
jgi:hypothetical protein